jgi:hypothetical protein
VDYLIDNFDGFFEQVHSGDADAAASSLVALLVNELSSPAFARRGDLSDYACTLIFAAAVDGRLLIGHLGDGVAFSVSGGRPEVASLPDNGEFSNETYFVTGPDAAQRLRFTARMDPAPQSIVLVSDGTGVSLFKRTDGSVASAVSRLCEWVTVLPRRKMNAVLKDNLQSVFCQKTMDDCSIAIMAAPRSFSSSADFGTGSSVS